MINQYRDLRGIRILEEVIQEELDSVGKSELEIIDFIGQDNANINGYLSQFLQGWVPMHKHLGGR